MVAEHGRGEDTPWEWGENGADAKAWNEAEKDYNLFKGFSTDEYLAEFYKRDFAGWTAFQVEVSAAGESGSGPMVVKHMMGTLATLAEKMRDLTEKWYRDSMRAKTARVQKEFRFQGEAEEDKKKVILDERLFRKVLMLSEDTSKYRGWYFDLMVAIGMADSKLAIELQRFMKDMSAPGELEENDNAENWKYSDDPNLDDHMYEKFSGELFGVLAAD